MAKIHDSDFSKRPRRRVGWKRILVISLIVVLALVGFGVPLALQNRNFVVSMANKYAGLAPMRIDLTAIEGGWFRPIKVRGLRLVDEQGAELIQIAEVETELTLLNAIANYHNLKMITVRGASVQLDVQPGTTNLEQAFKPFLAMSPTPTTAAPSNTTTTSAVPFAGRVRIADAVVHARDSVDLTSWDLILKQADLPLPTAEQPLPPMTLIGTLQQTTARPGEVLMGGQFNIQTQPLAQPLGNNPKPDLIPLKMTIVTNGLPLHWYDLVKRRFPELPIERIVGLATIQTDVELHNQQHVVAQIQTAQIDALQLSAPDLVGPRGASIQQMRLSGSIHKSLDRIRTEGLTLQSDVGNVSVVADLPFPPPMPTVGQPWLLDSDYDVNGAVNLAKVIQVAPDLIQMQDQVQLVSGQATLHAVQLKTVGDAKTPPVSKFQLDLGGLQANMRGTNMRWDQALKAVVDIKPSPSGVPVFKADCTAEFCDIHGEGGLLQGQLAGSFDLSKMQQRLSQWFALPVESMTGSAECQIAWKQDEGNRLIANGAIKTTPVRLTNKHGQLNEPAWEGEFQLVGRVDQGSLIQIDRSLMKLAAQGELLSATVLEPISLISATPGMTKLPPAGIQLKLAGDLAGWQRRAQLFAGVDPGVQVGGQCELDASGVIDATHVQLTKASLNATEFNVQSGTSRYFEPQLIGNFEGRIDTQDLTKLQVDNLLVQTLSFALQGKDEAVPNQGLARTGNAAFRINPNQLMNSIQSVPPTMSSIAVEGDVTGQIRWQVDPKQLSWVMTTDAKDIRATQPNANQASTKLVSTSGAESQSTTVLWEEPEARMSVNGRYDIATGNLEIPQSQLQTQWFAYGGATTMNSTKDKTTIVSKGNVTYDAALVAERLKPWTGSYLAIQGQRTQPIEVTWTSNSNPNSSWADSLQAKSSIGWDQANLIGIPIGKSEVPLRIENGHFLTKAEIPVSQGKLRWNLDGNIAGTPLSIVQTPETVIDNVAITPQMCQGWLKYIAPLLADVTSVQGNLSLKIDEAIIVPLDLPKQTVKGELMVHGANVGPGPLADQLLMLVQQIRNFRKGVGAADGGGAATSWLQMPEQRVQFDVQQGRVAHKNMQIQAGDVVINTSGSVGIDGALELIASVPIQKDWVDKTPALQSLAGQFIQVPLRGTVQRPQLDYSSITSLAQQVGTAALRNEAQKQIEKGMNKFLGPLSNQLAPFQQGMQQMQQGVQQNMPQLPLPNLQNFQLPGFGGSGPFGGGAPPPAVPPQGK